MRIERRYTKEGQSPYANMTFRHATSEIRNPDGSVVFRAEDVEVPEFWSQVASDVLAQKYFTAGKKSQSFTCNHKATIETGLVQSFTGTIENGVLVALPEKEAEPTGADAGSCISSHPADRIVAAKLVGDQLTFYRTDGLAYPETVQLTKQ